jgi:hypothetical protein
MDIIGGALKKSAAARVGVGGGPIRGGGQKKRRVEAAA